MKGLKIKAVFSSKKSEEIAIRGGIPRLDINKFESIDLTIDGADEIDDKFQMIKGGGGALFREKILASSSKKMIVIVDHTKVVKKLGTHALPIEVLPFGVSATIFKLSLSQLVGSLRKKDDGLNSVIAGGIAGWVATKTLSPEYWHFYLTFIGSRLIGATHKVLIQKKVLNKENTHLHAWAMLSFAQTTHCIGYFLHPYMLKDDMYGLFEKMSALTPREQKWHHAGMTYSHRRMIEKYGPYP